MDSSENEKSNNSIGTDLIPPSTPTTSNKKDDQNSSQSPDPGKDALPPEPPTPSLSADIDDPPIDDFRHNSRDDIPLSEEATGVKDDELEHEIPIVEEPPDLETVSQEIDHYLSSLHHHHHHRLTTTDDSNSKEDDDESENPPADVPIFIEQFVVLVESKIEEYDGVESQLKWSQIKPEESASFLESMDRISKLFNSLGKLSSNPKYNHAINRVGTVLQSGMSYLEESFKSLLLELHTTVDSSSSSSSSATTTKRSGNSDPKPPEPSNHRQEENGEQVLQQSSSQAAAEPANSNSNPDPDPPNELRKKKKKLFREYPEEMLLNLNKLAKCMIEGGFEAECCRAYFLARRNVMEERLQKLGFERHSIDDVQKIHWGTLEKKINSWLTTVRQCMAVEFPNERHLSALVFSDDYLLISQKVFSSLSRGVLIQLLNFAEAAAMTKLSIHKLFAFLEVYEALRDVLPNLDDVLMLPQCNSSGRGEDIKSDISLVKSRFGEGSVNILCELENSINNDPAKPSPGGAVHPITRYTMNYLVSLASNHALSIEQVFREHKKIDRAESGGHGSSSDFDTVNNSVSQDVQVAAKGFSAAGAGAGSKTTGSSAFQAQVTKLMDTLHYNLEMKSKPYKDVSLVSIFMMNNGRYILQKVRNCEALNRLMGDTWCRKKSSQLRQYHKNYQRDTWGKALNCLMNHEGLNVNGKVVKPVLKDRFKNFTAMFDEIHKIQNNWIVGDDQLRSELRVSISNMVVPAYRAFLARYGQTLTPGRQTEKYIKYQPEDIETIIDDLFDDGKGPPPPAGKRKL